MDDLEVVESHITGMSRADLAQVAEAAGVSFHTLLKIRDKTTLNPRFGTVRKLARVIRNVKPS